MPYKPPMHRPARLTQATSHDEQVRNRQPHRRLLWSSRFRRFRRWLLGERPICERCQRAAAVDVHHLRRLADHPEDLCDQERCECLCHRCHGQATRAGE
jgi:hypothetical protein